MSLSPSVTIVLLNISILALTYFYVFPKVAANDLNKMMWNDVLALAVSLTVAGFLFANSRLTFQLLFTEVNWFWFTFSTYVMFETPVMLWYLKKHKLLFRAS